ARATEQPAPAAATGTAEQDAAVALVNGEYAQGALQQLLPWLQAMQGQAAQNATQETTDPALLPPAEDGLPQALPALTADQRGGRQGQDLSAEASATAKDGLSKEAATAGE